MNNASIRRSLGCSSLALLLAACGADQPDLESTLPDVTVATFLGSYDATAGSLTFERLADSPELAAASTAAKATFATVNVVQDGVPGSGPPESVELVTLSAGVVPGGCGTVDAFEGSVQINSFYTATRLKTPYVEILSLPAVGYESCKSAASPDPSISNALGLFSYGVGIAPLGTATATWNFRLPSTTSFTFTARVVAVVK